MTVRLDPTTVEILDEAGIALNEIEQQIRQLGFNKIDEIKRKRREANSQDLEWSKQHSKRFTLRKFMDEIGIEYGGSFEFTLMAIEYNRGTNKYPRMIISLMPMNEWPEEEKDLRLYDIHCPNIDVDVEKRYKASIVETINGNPRLIIKNEALIPEPIKA